MRTIEMLAALIAVSIWSACEPSKEALVSVSVLAPAATATHGTSNDVGFSP